MHDPSAWVPEGSVSCASQKQGTHAASNQRSITLLIHIHVPQPNPSLEYSPPLPTLPLAPIIHRKFSRLRLHNGSISSISQIRYERQLSAPIIGIVVSVVVFTKKLILSNLVASMERPNRKIQYSTFLETEVKDYISIG